MAYTFSVHSVKDSFELRNLRAAIANTITEMKRAEDTLKVSLAGLFRQDKNLESEADYFDVVPRMSGVEAAASPVEMELVVTDEDGHHQAVYGRYRVTRAREQGLRAVAEELGLGAEADIAIARTHGPAGGRPTLLSFPAKRRRA